jgi:uncharacterized protein (TIGR02266 family)
LDGVITLLNGEKMGRLDEDNAIRFFCPYCTHEITPETIQCPECGYIYGPDTLNVLTKLPKNGSSNKSARDLKPVQVRKKFKIAYPTPKAFVNNYLNDVGTGGLFIKTKAPFDPGEQFNLRVVLPFIEEECEVFCEVAWIRKEEDITPQAKSPPGMGLKFVNPTKKVSEKFLSILRGSLH